MTRERYWNIKKALLIHIINTSSTMTAAEKKALNKRIYQAGGRTKTALKPGESYRGLYDWLDRAYHERIVSGQA